MTAPAIDLTLPTDQQLLGAAAPNPEVEAARITQGSPGSIHALGEQLMAAGADLDELYEQSRRAQKLLAGSFTNNGAPVYDEDLHRRRLPPGFRDAGSLVHDVGRRLLVVGEELAASVDSVNRSLNKLWDELNARRSAFAAEVHAARDAGGLIPVGVATGLQARRDVVAGEMQESVRACGRVVGRRVSGYDQVLASCLPMPGELVAVAPAPGAVDTGGVSLSPVLGGRLEAGTPQATGPQAEILPVPGSLPPDRGFTPGPGGSGPLITLPAPNIGDTVQDGPGSGQRGEPSGLRVDSDTPADDSVNGQEQPTRPQIHEGQQGKHLPGHPNFDPAAGRSILTVDPEDLLDDVGGGSPVNSVPRGEPGFKERIDFGRVIGEYVDQEGKSAPTTVGIVHHQKAGLIHIVPARPA